MNPELLGLAVMTLGALLSRLLREYLNVGKPAVVPEEPEEIYPEVLEMAQERGIPYEEMLAGLRQAAQEWERSLPWYTRLWIYLKSER